MTPPDKFNEALISLLERLCELKSRPPEINQWNESWFEAHSVFIYETFLYIIAALLKGRAFVALHEVFTSRFLLADVDRSGNARFESFSCFFGHSETLQSVLAPEGITLYSPAAALIKQQADRTDLPFSAIMEAELLVLMMAFLTPGASWHPQTLLYAPYRNEFTFFLRATQKKGFRNLAIVTGVDDVNELRTAVKNGQERLQVERWHNFSRINSFWDSINMDKLDSFK